MAFIVFFTSNLALTLFASVITAFIAPAAAGSGIPEVKAYLNGVDAPGIYTLQTLFIKVYIFFLLSVLGLPSYHKFICFIFNSTCSRFKWCFQYLIFLFFLIISFLFFFSILYFTCLNL